MLVSGGYLLLGSKTVHFLLTGESAKCDGIRAQSPTQQPKGTLDFRKTLGEDLAAALDSEYR